MAAASGATEQRLELPAFADTPIRIVWGPQDDEFAAFRITDIHEDGRGAIAAMRLAGTRLRHHPSRAGLTRPTSAEVSPSGKALIDRMSRIEKPTETVTWPGGVVVVVGSERALARWM